MTDDPRTQAMIDALDLDPKIIEALDLFVEHSASRMISGLSSPFRALCCALIIDGLGDWAIHRTDELPADIARRIRDLLDQVESECGTEGTA